MNIICSRFESPYFNLAAEEHLLKATNDDFFMLWQSSPCVVVGKHQNTYAETNFRYTRENNIQIARRLSGGGTVFHGAGNINFTFIVNGDEGKLIDFKKHLRPIVGFLKTLGIEATIGEKNDLRIGDLKISGNAEHVYRKRTLHHGTLLYNADLHRLNQSILLLKKKYTDKAVQSNRSQVTNIIDYMDEPLDLSEFRHRLLTFVGNEFQGAMDYSFSENQIHSIEKLMLEKYQTPEWIFSYSPRYTFENSFAWNSQLVQVHLSVEKGHIQHAKISIPGENNLSTELASRLIGKSHLLEAIEQVLAEFQFPTSLEKELLYSLF